MKSRIITIDEDKGPVGFAAVKVLFSNLDEASDPGARFEVTVEVFERLAGHDTREALEEAAMGKAKRFLMHI